MFNPLLYYKNKYNQNFIENKTSLLFSNGITLSNKAQIFLFSSVIEII